jgi:hypothetical protein
VLTHQRHSHNAAPLGRAGEALDLVTDPHLAVILINVTPAQAEHVTQSVQLRRRNAAMIENYRTLCVNKTDKGVLSVVIDAPPMNMIGPELVRSALRRAGPVPVPRGRSFLRPGRPRLVSGLGVAGDDRARRRQLIPAV